MEDNCPICFDEPQKRCTLDCGHIFCCECIHEWTRYKLTCPLCRQDILFGGIFSDIFTSAYNRVEFGGHTYVIMMEDVLMDDGEYVEMPFMSCSNSRPISVGYLMDQSMLTILTQQYISILKRGTFAWVVWAKETVTIIKDISLQMSTPN